MCLVKIERTARVATTPVKVYKILTSDNHSPFQNQEYHVGKNTPVAGKDIFSSSGRTIDGGYLHAYLSESRAAAFAKYRTVISVQNSLAGLRLKMVEMYIPAGTQYWLGESQEVAAECLYWPEDGNDNNINNK